jgi:hypothetical protein
MRNLKWLALAVGAIWVISGQAQAKDERQGAVGAQTQAADNQAGSAKAPLIIQVQGAETPQERAADHASDIARHDYDQTWTVRIGVAAVVAALIQAAVLVGQIFYLRRTVTDTEKMLKAAQRSASAAEGAITKSDELLEHSRAATETELRPYIFLDSTEWHWMHDPANPAAILNWRLTLHWKNMGQTPARRVINAVTYRAFRRGMPKTFAFRDPPGNRGIIGSMGPGHLIVTRIEIPLALMTDAWMKRKRLYYWGWVEYDDGFPKSPRRRTELCAEILPLIDPTLQVNQPKVVDALHERFNGADEDCYRKPYT